MKLSTTNEEKENIRKEIKNKLTTFGGEVIKLPTKKARNYLACSLNKRTTGKVASDLIIQFKGGRGASALKITSAQRRTLASMHLQIKMSWRFNDVESMIHKLNKPEFYLVMEALKSKHPERGSFLVREFLAFSRTLRGKEWTKITFEDFKRAPRSRLPQKKEPKRKGDKKSKPKKTSRSKLAFQRAVADYAQGRNLSLEEVRAFSIKNGWIIQFNKMLKGESLRKKIPGEVKSKVGSLGATPLNESAASRNVRERSEAFAKRNYERKLEKYIDAVHVPKGTKVTKAQQREFIELKMCANRRFLWPEDVAERKIMQARRGREKEFLIQNKIELVEHKSNPYQEQINQMDQEFLLKIEDPCT